MWIVTFTVVSTLSSGEAERESESDWAEYPESFCDLSGEGIIWWDFLEIKLAMEKELAEAL